MPALTSGAVGHGLGDAKRVLSAARSPRTSMVIRCVAPSPSSGIILRQFDADLVERCLELLEIPRQPSACRLRRSGGQQQDRVVGAHVPFDADAVEALIGGRGDSAVGRLPAASRASVMITASMRRHVGADHAGPLRHAGDADFLPAECQADDWRACASVSVVIMPRAAATNAASSDPKLRGRGRDSASDLVHRQKMADHAGRHDERLLRLGTARLRGQARHFFAHRAARARPCRRWRCPN